MLCNIKCIQTASPCGKIPLLYFHPMFFGIENHSSGVHMTIVRLHILITNYIFMIMVCRKLRKKVNRLLVFVDTNSPNLEMIRQSKICTLKKAILKFDT